MKTQIKLKTKQVDNSGQILTVRWLAMETADFFTTGDAAKLLGITDGGLRKIISQNELLIECPTRDQKQFLTERSVIKIKDNRTKLVPRETMDALVKIVNTPQAWIIWGQLLDAIRNPKSYVSLQHDIGGNERLEQIIDEANAVMSVRLDAKKFIKDAICSALRRHDIVPFDAMYFGEKWFNGTINSFYKMLNAKFAPEGLALTGKDFLLQVLNTENYQEILDYVNTVQLSDGQIKGLKKVEKSRMGLLLDTSKKVDFSKTEAAQ